MEFKNYEFKIVLLGKGCVGKTSLFLRYCENKFNEDHAFTTIGSFKKKELAINGSLVKLSIWDTAGQEKFHALGPFYYRNSNGAVIVYDVTDLESLTKAKLWIQELKSIIGESICLALVANKCDLLDKRCNPLLTPIVSKAITYCKTLDKIVHYCTSAKLNQGLNELFLDLSKRMIELQIIFKSNLDLTSSFENRGILIKEDEDEDENQEFKKCNC